MVFIMMYRFCQISARKSKNSPFDFCFYLIFQSMQVFYTNYIMYNYFHLNDIHINRSLLLLHRRQRISKYNITKISDYKNIVEANQNNFKFMLAWRTPHSSIFYHIVCTFGTPWFCFCGRIRNSGRKWKSRQKNHKSSNGIEIDQTRKRKIKENKCWCYCNCNQYI